MDSCELTETRAKDSQNLGPGLTEVLPEFEGKATNDKTSPTTQ